MNRELFLQQVRQAAQQGGAYRVHLHEIPDGAGYVGTAGELCDAMVEQVNAVGGVGKVCEDWPLAREAVAALFDQYSVKSALCWQHAVLDELRLSELLRSHEIALLDYDSLAELPADQQRTNMLAADIGISSVDYAIAETGTLVVGSRPGQERLASLLPAAHVAIIAENQIVPDLFDVFAKLENRPDNALSSNIALITGPSKTGDIELQLTTGVHGPGKWHIIVVRDK